VERQPARWRAQVEVVPKANESDAERFEVGYGDDQVFQAAAEPI
jgi:hypothetical protein